MRDKKGSLGLGIGVGLVLHEVAELRGQVEELRRARAHDRSRAELLRDAGRMIRSGGALSQAQVAAYLGVSTKKIQRMEAQGHLRRCPGVSGVVRYAAGDVLRLASGRREA